jgi:phosphoribosylaminoimidazolecarboxamide formyltransferase/IMP cyclohydrolase
LIKSALISVSDKTGIVEFARELLILEYRIIATGNTAKKLTAENIEVTGISEITGFPEIFEGRVKTLHPKIFGGILMRRDNPDDKKQAGENDIHPVDLVCVNLYPFVRTASDPQSTLEDIIENIDIGGPSLIRAAAKNYKYVSVLTDPGQYNSFIEELRKGEISEDTRLRLSIEAFSHTAFYDTNISNHLEERFSLPHSHIRVNFEKEKELRYGENPHQSAALYGDFHSYFDVLHGKELSYNNILDLVAAAELSEDLGDTNCVIIKHQNPAGAAKGKDVFEAYIKALRCDPVSAFGGIVVFTEEVDSVLAEKLNEIFLEIICAPSYTDDAMKILRKKRDRRLLRQLKSVRTEKLSYRNIPGGVIAQDADRTTMDIGKLEIITEKKPGDKEMRDLQFAWVVAKHTRSNAIVFAKNNATLAVGAGQMSRLDSARIASLKAQEHGLDLTGSVAASDAFFPFPDTLLEIIKYGATSVIQPGGSVRDNEVIEAANQNGISMVFTGIRHFKH